MVVIIKSTSQNTSWKCRGRDTLRPILTRNSADVTFLSVTYCYEQPSWRCV